MKKHFWAKSVLLSTFIVSQFGASGVTATTNKVPSEQTVVDAEVFLWSPQKLEAISGLAISELVTSKLKGKIQVQGKGVCAVKGIWLYVYREGKCIVSASLKTPGTKTTKKETKTYLVAASTVPALVAGMPALKNGVSLSTHPVIARAKMKGLTYPDGPNWSNGYLKYAYQAYWSCLDPGIEGQYRSVDGCDIKPWVSYFEQQGWSLTSSPELVDDFTALLLKDNSTIIISADTDAMPQGTTLLMLQIGNPRNPHAYD
jgi:hypothetical protein